MVRSPQRSLEIVRGAMLAHISLHPAPFAQPILAASNRGNKLKQGAKYVHEGALAFMNGPDVYKHVGRAIQSLSAYQQCELIGAARKLNMLATVGTYSSATLAGIPSTGMNLTTVRVIRTRMRRPRTRMPTLGLDWRVRTRLLVLAQCR